MKLSKKGRYALRALRHLAGAHGDKAVSIHALASRERMSAKYLEQVFSALRKRGLLVSSRGKDGGYVLRLPPDRIVLGDVIRAVDGPLAPIPCASRTAPARCADCGDPYDRCWLRCLMLRVRDAVSAVLDGMTLADIAYPAKRRSPHPNPRRKDP